MRRDGLYNIICDTAYLVKVMELVPHAVDDEAENAVRIIPFRAEFPCHSILAPSAISIVLRIHSSVRHPEGKRIFPIASLSTRAVIIICASNEEKLNVFLQAYHAAFIHHRRRDEKGRVHKKVTLGVGASHSPICSTWQTPPLPPPPPLPHVFAAQTDEAGTRRKFSRAKERRKRQRAKANKNSWVREEHFLCGPGLGF